MMILRFILPLVLIAGCAVEVGNTQPEDSGISDGLDGAGEYGDPGTDGAADGDAGRADEGPVCENECYLGRQQCAEVGYQICGEYDDDPCTEWSDPTACAVGQICDEGECVADCLDVCTLDSRRCTGDGYETCGNHDQDRCLEWGGLSLCDAGQICESGECVVDCGTQCPQGARRCAEGGVEGIETCADYDGDSCREWGGLELCDADQICDPVEMKCLRPYPPGPYGTAVGEVLRNLCLEECICEAGMVKGAPFCMRDLLDNKATLISVHAGWCSACHYQTDEAEQLYQAYRAQGLGMVFVLFEDDLERSSRQAVLDYGCWEKGWYGLSFMIAIDPGLQQMLPYFYDGSIPLNIIVDDEMVIRYVLEGYDAVSLEATIRLLLAE